MSVNEAESASEAVQDEAQAGVREGIVQSSIPADELARLSDDIISALKTVYDPEIPADIFELGLIYKIDVEDDRMVKIDMTLTAPGCPVAARCRAGSRMPWVRSRAFRASRSRWCSSRRGRRPACRKRRRSRSAGTEFYLSRPNLKA